MEGADSSRSLARSRSAATQYEKQSSLRKFAGWEGGQIAARPLSKRSVINSSFRHDVAGLSQHKNGTVFEPDRLRTEQRDYRIRHHRISPTLRDAAPL